MWAQRKANVTSLALKAGDRTERGHNKVAAIGGLIKFTRWSKQQRVHILRRLKKKEYISSRFFLYYKFAIESCCVGLNVAMTNHQSMFSFYYCIKNDTSFQRETSWGGQPLDIIFAASTHPLSTHP